MSDQKREWARNLFGPLWAWLIIGAGVTMMASAYGLSSIGLAHDAALAVFLLGAVITVAVLTLLIALGNRSWEAYWWWFHTEDNDLIMGRKYSKRAIEWKEVRGPWLLLAIGSLLMIILFILLLLSSARSQ